MGYLTDLTDTQWSWLEPIFAPQEGPGRRRTVSLRRVIDALMYQDRTGCQWRLIPRDFPPSGTVRYYFDKWNEDGTMLEIHDCLRRAVRLQQGRESQPRAIVIDSQSVKANHARRESSLDIPAIDFELVYNEISPTPKQNSFRRRRETARDSSANSSRYRQQE